uniref:Plexin-B1 n=1 Tax=Oncorhynchus kisutch TaxID=8019 RepID=A0A8C7CZR0_ONCKI
MPLGMSLISAPLVFLLVTTICSLAVCTYPRFSRNDTSFEHLVLHPDPSVGTVYVGARDHLFQLDGLDGLRLEQEERTGPVTDSKECLPPVTEANCPQARHTSNHNKLLLVDPSAMELITCGNVHQGTCQKRSLTSVKEVLFSTERPVDTQYVAANDPGVSTVGLVMGPRGGERAVLYVGRGYTSSHPPISTRHLAHEPVFSYDETAKLAVAGRLSEYDHHFVAAFARHGHVYFLFYRRDIKAVTREYRTYAARVCLDDSSYYSYVEVPLVCHSSSTSSPERNYNLLQAAQVGQGGGREGEKLLGLFSTRASSSNGPSDDSALCVYALDELDRHIDSTRDLCYTQDGRVEGGGEVAYIEYEVKSSCANLPTNTLKAYPCGSDHTPSPMASRVPIEAEAVLDSPSARLTAVAVSVRAGHTIAFLGDSKGNLHKVFLGSGGRVEKYSSILIQPNSPISSDLLLDQMETHIYIMTSTMVEKRPVAECGDHLDCQSCLSAREPYCGWCVLEGRCGQRSQCSRGALQGQWLWSFDQQQQCLSIQSLSLYNISLGIAVSVKGLPSLVEGEEYKCFYQDVESPANVTDTGVTCLSPDTRRLPLIGQGEDSVTVPLSLRFLNVTVAAWEFTFFDCGVVQQLSGGMPCRGCVSSRWGCNWCLHQHFCTPNTSCDDGVTIYNKHVSPPTLISQSSYRTASWNVLYLLTSLFRFAFCFFCKHLVFFVMSVLFSKISCLSCRFTVVPSSLLLWSCCYHLKLKPPTATPPATKQSDTVTPTVLAAPTLPYTEVSVRTTPPVPASTDVPLATPPTTPEPTAVPTTFSQTIATTTFSTTLATQATTALEVTTSLQAGAIAEETKVEGDGDGSLSRTTGGTEQTTVTMVELLDWPEALEMFPSSTAGLTGLTGMEPSSPDTTSTISSDCPCVEKVQGSSLLPVNVERKITLVGRHLHLFQDEGLDYECVLTIEGRSVVVDAYVETEETQPSLYFITCQLHQVTLYSISVPICAVVGSLTCGILSVPVTLFNCSVGRSDCSRCRMADQKYGCVWCGGARSRCSYRDSCAGEIKQSCPAPVIHFMEPISGPVDGGTVVTISGSNLGQKAEDIQNSVTLAGVPCTVINSRYEISSRIVCETTASGGQKSGQASVEVKGGGLGLSSHRFSFQDPVLLEIAPRKGPKAGGSALTVMGQSLTTGHLSEVSVLIGGVPLVSANRTGAHGITVRFGRAERHLEGDIYYYTSDPNVTKATPSKSFLSGGRLIRVSGQNLDVVQEPRIRVTQMAKHPYSFCLSSSSLMLCPTPAVGTEAHSARVKVDFLLDNLHFDFSAVGSGAFSYELNPRLYPLNQNDPSKPYQHKPGSIISVEGENLDLAIFKEEVVALIGDGVCSVKTLTHNHLYCEPPSQQPSVMASKKQEGMDSLPEFTVQMGNLNFSLGRVQYDTQVQSTFPLEAQVGLGVGASIVALIVLIIVLIYRRKSKQAVRDYKKVQIQLENLETSVRDRCKKEFTDLMTEMMDCSSDLVGSGIPFLDYRAYAERIFFPGHRESPLRRDLDVPECRRQTVEQGLVQLSNLLNSKLFLTTFIHTLEVQRTFSPRDRAYVASLLTVALHGKLEYFTDILKTLLNDLVVQYMAKNPRLMLRRTESVVEKLLTNWMSMCLFTFLRDTAGESFYMLFRAIKHQVDKGPVDVVTGKAKYTLNDNRLLREDVDYKTLTLNVLMPATGNGGIPQTAPAKVLDCDTITQVKEKLLEQAWKSMSFSQRPHTDSLHLEWRAGTAGHLILSDEDLTSVVQGSWKRLNTLQHYKVPDGATVALVPRNTKHIHNDSHDYIPGEKTPMLDDGDEGGVKLWHLVKANEEPDLPKHRRGSLRERERAKAIPEIYLTRLLSMKGTLQKFVDDLFTVILSTNQPVPMAVKYFFDLLDEQALQHNITDSETIHIWKTNSLPLRFWINILKNPQFIFDVQASDHVDAVLSVIAQTFMDSCTIAEHKLGRDSPINKLLYARDIPRYKQMVERYYADIRQTISASDQEMNSALAGLSRVNYLVALHELYKYINKYYDQIITALEEDSTAQKMQLGYRLQQISAAVENKVTDL